MTLGNAAKETTVTSVSRPKVAAAGRRVQSASSAVRERRPTTTAIVVEPLTAWEDTRLKSAGKRLNTPVLFLSEYHPILPIFGGYIQQGIWNKRRPTHRPTHLFYTFALYLAKNSSLTTHRTIKGWLFPRQSRSNGSNSCMERIRTSSINTSVCLHLCRKIHQITMAKDYDGIYT